MSAYDGLSVYYGDIHNHSGISYGLGTIEEPMANARERLDFCAVTGHAHWPDMPPDRRAALIHRLADENTHRPGSEQQMH